MQEGWDWRWISLTEGAGRAGRTAAVLAGLAPGQRVGFRDRLDPWSLALDCGVRAAGGTAVPLAARHRPAVAAHRGSTLWLSVPGEGEADVPPGIERREVAPEVVAGADPPPPALLQPAAEPAAGVLVVDEAGAVHRRSAAELAAAAATLAERLALAVSESLAGAGGRRRRSVSRRPITVLHRPLEEPLARLLFTWAGRRDAAILLEPRSEALAATAAWARPTLLAAASADLPRLRRAAEEAEGRRPRRPFGRLQALVVEQMPPAGEAGFWHDRGVALVPADL